MESLELQALSARKALVRIAGVDAGDLEMLATDEYRFRYRTEYWEKGNEPSISLMMPVRKEPYMADHLFPFFDNLLFEGDQLRLAEKQFQLNRYSAVDRFKLLLLTGQRLLSPISVHPIVGGIPLDLPKQWHAPKEEKLHLLSLRPAYAGL